MFVFAVIICDDRARSNVGFFAHLCVTKISKMFGLGTYLATNSSKADIYTEPNAAGERCVL